MSLTSAPPSRWRSVVGNRDLRLLLAAGLVSRTGDWLLGTGVAFEVYALTGSTVASAAVLLATQLPQVLLGPVAGVVVDRHDRRRTVVGTNLALGAVLLPLVAVTDGGQVWIVVAVTAATSCLVPFAFAAEATMVPALVAPEHLVTANALNGQLRNVARLIGAAAGGLLVAAGGLPLVAIVDLGTFLLAALLVLRIRHRAPARPVRRPSASSELVDGLRIVRREPALLVLLAFFALTGVGEAIMDTLLAPFVQDVLGGGAAVYGTILAAQAVGGIAGGLVVTVLGHRADPRLLFGLGALVGGLLDGALFLYPLLDPVPWPAVVLIAAVGLPFAAMTAGMTTVLQLAAPAAALGRVVATLTTAQNATMLAGTVVAGTLAAALGVLPVIVVQGAVYVLGGLLVLLVLRPGGGALTSARGAAG